MSTHRPNHSVDRTAEKLRFSVPRRLCRRAADREKGPDSIFTNHGNSRDEESREILCSLLVVRDSQPRIVGRSVKVKKKLLEELMASLSQQGLDLENVMVCFKETTWENWSFGGGRLIHA